MNAEHRTELCSCCRSVLSSTEPRIPNTWIVPAATHGFDTFYEAVKNKCIICSIIWDLSFEHHRIWFKSPELWEPLQYMPYKDDGDELVKIRVLREHPLKDDAVSKATTAEFYLVHVDSKFFRKSAFLVRSDSGTWDQKRVIVDMICVPGTEYKQQLEFPTIKCTVEPDDLLTIGQKWLSQCLLTHPKCQQPIVSERNWLPTRLLDIGEADSATWKLFVVSEDSSPPVSTEYMTLSYRWPNEPSLLLLSTNVANFRSGRPISDLPILFRDFISIAWRFSIRYIWIDALCIIQDSEKDWDTEAPTMHLVYSNSKCNIAASNAASSENSLFNFKDRDSILPGLVDSPLFATEPRLYYIFDKSYWDRQIHAGPLHNRGWVYQERFLSPRVIYFGKYQLLWECRTQHKCEAFPKGIPNHWSDKAMDSLLGKPPTDDALSSGRFPIHPISLWNHLIQEYSRCELSYPSDRLVAVAGIAKVFQNVTKDSLRSKTEKIPGISGAVVVMGIGRRAVSMDGPSSDGKLLVELLNVEVTTSLPDEMSTILDGSVLLKGRLTKAVFRHFEPPFITLNTAYGELQRQFYPDTLDITLSPNHYIFYLPFRLYYLSSFNPYAGKIVDFNLHVSCMILEEVNPGSDNEVQYRRLGFLDIYDHDDIDVYCPEEDEMQVFKVI